MLMSIVSKCWKSARLIIGLSLPCPPLASSATVKLVQIQLHYEQKILYYFTILSLSNLYNMLLLKPETWRLHLLLPGADLEQVSKKHSNGPKLLTLIWSHCRQQLTLWILSPPIGVCSETACVMLLLTVVCVCKQKGKVKRLHHCFFSAIKKTRY